MTDTAYENAGFSDDLQKQWKWMLALAVVALAHLPAAVPVGRGHVQVAVRAERYVVEKSDVHTGKIHNGQRRPVVLVECLERTGVYHPKRVTGNRHSQGCMKRDVTATALDEFEGIDDTLW